MTSVGRLKKAPSIAALRMSPVQEGSFSPFIWTIELAASTAVPLNDLDAESRRTFEHEFGHLIHYFTSYLGLTDLFPWLMMQSTLNDTARLSHEETHEELVTRQASEIRRLSRWRQSLVIDDEYYFELRPQIAEEAAQRGPYGVWLWKEVIGHLFHTDGRISDRAFWGLRFYLDTLSAERSFARMPAGLRCYLENMATSLDLLADLANAKTSAERDAVFAPMLAEAYHPDFVHYYALIHRMEGALRRHGIAPGPVVFVAASHAILLCMEIPYDIGGICSAVVTAAMELAPDIVAYMRHPHPSFLFPVVANALASLGLSPKVLSDPLAFEYVASGVLTRLGLPNLYAIQTYRDKRRHDLELFSHKVGLRAAERLLAWTSSYDRQLSRSDKVIVPSRHLRDIPPIPIRFADDTALEGTAVMIADAEHLSYLFRRYQEMIRYPVVRDIVEIEAP